VNQSVLFIVSLIMKRSIGLIAAIVAAVVVPSDAAPRRKQAPAPTIRVASIAADRVSSTCVGAVGCVAAPSDLPAEPPSEVPEPPADLPADPPADVPELSVRPSCLTGQVLQPSPLGECKVTVAVTVAGTSPAKTATRLMVSLAAPTSTPFADSPESALPAQIDPRTPPAPGTPSVCQALETAQSGAGCGAQDAPKTWTQTSSFKGGVFASTFRFEFPATGVDGTCEEFSVIAMVRSGTRLASKRLPGVEVCA
jgi:hypothetical protein